MWAWHGWKSHDIGLTEPNRHWLLFEGLIKERKQRFEPCLLSHVLSHPLSHRQCKPSWEGRRSKHWTLSNCRQVKASRTRALSSQDSPSFSKALHSVASFSSSPSHQWCYQRQCTRTVFENFAIADFHETGLHEGWEQNYLDFLESTRLQCTPQHGRTGGMMQLHAKSLVVSWTCLLRASTQVAVMHQFCCLPSTNKSWTEMAAAFLLLYLYTGTSRRLYITSCLVFWGLHEWTNSTTCLNPRRYSWELLVMKMHHQQTPTDGNPPPDQCSP